MPSCMNECYFYPSTINDALAMEMPFVAQVRGVLGDSSVPPPLPFMHYKNKTTPIPVTDLRTALCVVMRAVLFMNDRMFANISDGITNKSLLTVSSEAKLTEAIRATALSRPAILHTYNYALRYYVDIANRMTLEALECGLLSEERARSISDLLLFTNAGMAAVCGGLLGNLGATMRKLRSNLQVFKIIIDWLHETTEIEK